MFKTLSPEAKNTTIENEEDITVGSIVPAVQCIVVLIRFTKSLLNPMKVLSDVLTQSNTTFVTYVANRDRVPPVCPQLLPHRETDLFTTENCHNFCHLRRVQETDFRHHIPHNPRCHNFCHLRRGSEQETGFRRSRYLLRQGFGTTPAVSPV